MDKGRIPGIEVLWGTGICSCGRRMEGVRELVPGIEGWGWDASPWNRWMCKELVLGSDDGGDKAASA